MIFFVRKNSKSYLSYLGEILSPQKLANFLSNFELLLPNYGTNTRTRAKFECVPTQSVVLFRVAMEQQQDEQKAIPVVDASKISVQRMGQVPLEDLKGRLNVAQKKSGNLFFLRFFKRCWISPAPGLRRLRLRLPDRSRGARGGHGTVC